MLRESSPGPAMPSGQRHNAHAVHLPVFRYITRHLGPEVVAEVAERSGIGLVADALMDPSRWCSYDTTRRLLEAAADVLGGEDALRHAAEYLDLDMAPEDSEDVVATIQSLGGPAAILRAITDTAAKFSAVIAMQTGEVGDDSGIVIARSVPGFPRYRLLCHATAGLLSMSPRLFGLPPAVVVEEQCETRGADECRFRMTWDTPPHDGAGQITRSELELGSLRRRFGALRETVTELVSGHDVDTVLVRIVERAARAVRAPRFLLAVHLDDGATPRIHALGLTAEEADAMAGELLHGPSAATPSRLVVEVRSGRRCYGRLAAFTVQGAGFFDEERAILSAYGELAAAALDSATAIEELRRQSETTGALFDLARELSEVTTTADVATRLAAAAPRVTGSGVAAVMLADGERLTAAASVGLSPPAVERFAHFEIRVEDADRLKRAVQERTHYFRSRVDVRNELAEIMRASGTDAIVILPIQAGERLYGVLSASVVSDFERLENDAHLATRLGGLAAVAASAFRNAELLEQLHHQSLHDPLTGLPNKRLLEDRVDMTLADARRSGSLTGLLFIDLDRFKNVNDTLGHAAGDTILRQVAGRVRAELREVDTVARLGGDEFVVLLPKLGDIADAEIVARKLLGTLQEPFRADGHDLFVDASIGLAVGPHDGARYGDLLKAADAAMYAAKRGGRGTYRVYGATMATKTSDMLTMETELHMAVERGELRLVFQPQLDLRTMEVAAVEALVRWQHPARGLLGPDHFIALAEESGLIAAIDTWVVENACAQLARWKCAGIDVGMAVNVSDRDLRDCGFAERVRGALAAHGLAGPALEVEVSERVAETADEEFLTALEELRRIGVRIAVDDFGTGSAGFTRLLRGRVDTLKIDKSFVAEFESAGGDALVMGMISLGQTLGLRVVAEGVETAKQGAFLRRSGCDRAQGFYLSPPLEASAFEAMFARGEGG